MASSSSTFPGSCVCACGDPLIVCTAWIPTYLRRRYYICRNYNAHLGTGGCCDCKWLDGEASARSKEVIGVLLRHLKETEEGVIQLAEEKDDLLLLSDVANIEKNMAEKQVAALTVKVDELEGESSIYAQFGDFMSCLSIVVFKPILCF